MRSTLIPTRRKRKTFPFLYKIHIIILHHSAQHVPSTRNTIPRRSHTWILITYYIQNPCESRLAKWSFQKMMNDHKHPKISTNVIQATWQNLQFKYIFHTNIDKHIPRIQTICISMIYIITSSYFSKLCIKMKTMLW